MAEKMPKWRENQLKYNSDYQKENIKQITLKLNSLTEKELIDFLDTKDNKQGYIKALIKADMEHNK